MATVYVAEFSSVMQGAAVMPPLREQHIEISGESTQSYPFGLGTNCVKVHANGSCCIAFGIAPEANAYSMPFTRGQWEYFHVAPNMSLAVIAVY